MSRDRAYRQHVPDAISRIEIYTAPGEDGFLEDTNTQDAVLRNLEIIGEAVQNLSEGFKATESSIPWRQIAGLRDRLIHPYFGVSLPLVWNVVANHLPPLRTVVQQALDKLDPASVVP